MAIATLVAPLSISRAQKPSKYALTSYPIMLNILIVLVPLLLFGSVTYCIVLGNRAGDEMFASYLALLRAFSSSSIDAAEVGGATQRLQETSVEMIVSWERLWTVYASFIAIALAVRSTFAPLLAARLTRPSQLFTYSSASYFHTLVVSMRALRAQRASSDKLTSLGRAYASLITTTIVTALISVLYLALACSSFLVVEAQLLTSNLHRCSGDQDWRDLPVDAIDGWCRSRIIVSPFVAKQNRR